MQSLKTTLFTMFMALAMVGYTQVKLGVKFSPGISKAKATTNGNTFDISDNKGGVRFIGGLVLDMPFAENYYFSTGLNYASRRAAFTLSSGNFEYKEDLSLGYVQVPLTLKLYTNEVAIDKKIYFQVGSMLDFKVDDNINDQNFTVVEKFFFMDAGLIIGAGLEMTLGTNTAAFGGLTFQKGFINSVSEHIDYDNGADLIMKNSFFGLEVGVKF